MSGEVALNNGRATSKTYSAEDLQPFRSDYLTSGWQQDELILNQVIAADDRNSFTASYSVNNRFFPKDGVFHFTVPLAFICVAQLAIVGACLNLELTKKPGEVLLRRIDIKCKNLVTSTKNIEVMIELHKRLFLESGVYYEGSIDVNHSDFIGSGSFVMPLPPGFIIPE